MLPHWIISLDGGPRRVNHSAVLIEHKIYMFGGYCSSLDYKQSIPIDVHVLNTCKYCVICLKQVIITVKKICILLFIPGWQHLSG